jgi:peptidoglycan/LPS O-acetylase OafA/YrhL
MDGDISNPATAILAVIAGPFLVRASIAWYVQIRVWGLIGVRGGASLLRSDFPSPNEPRRETALSVVTFLVAGWFGTVVRDLGARPSNLWLAVYVAAAAVCVIWWFRRLRADDRRALAIRQRRQAEGEMKRFDAAATEGKLW